MQPPRSAFNFIIGASKCGTTALFDALKRHPEIHTADVKEPNFFSKDTEYNKGVSAYLERFLNWDAGRHQMALDASATYTEWPKYPEAASRLSSFYPHAKLVYVVRDPVERVRSHNQMNIVSDGASSANDDLTVADSYTKVSSYHSQLALYRTKFSRDSILVLSFDDLRARPGHVVSAVLSHFGLPPNEAVSIVPSHRSSLLYSTHFIKRALVDRALIAEGASTSVAVQMFRSLPLYEQKVVIRSAEEYYIPSAELQQRMRSILAPEMEMLHKEYGIDVSTWGF